MNRLIRFLSVCLLLSFVFPVQAKVEGVTNDPNKDRRDKWILPDFQDFLPRNTCKGYHRPNVENMCCPHPVSYTHLDVYKSQGCACASSGAASVITNPLICFVKVSERTALSVSYTHLEPTTRLLRSRHSWPAPTPTLSMAQICAQTAALSCSTASEIKGAH